MTKCFVLFSPGARYRPGVNIYVRVLMLCVASAVLVLELFAGTTET